MTHTPRQMQDTEGSFHEWEESGRPCYYDKCTGQVKARRWDSNDGAYEEWQYQCSCGHTWWVDEGFVTAREHGLDEVIGDLRLLTVTSVAMWGGAKRESSQIVMAEVVDRYVADLIENGEASEEHPWRLLTITIQRPLNIVRARTYMHGVDPALVWDAPVVMYLRPQQPAVGS